MSAENRLSYGVIVALGLVLKKLPVTKLELLFAKLSRFRYIEYGSRISSRRFSWFKEG